MERQRVVVALFKTSFESDGGLKVATVVLRLKRILYQTFIVGLFPRRMYLGRMTEFQETL